MEIVKFTYLGADCEYNHQTRNLHITSKQAFDSPVLAGNLTISKEHAIWKEDIKSITFKHPNTKLPSHIFDYFLNYKNLEFIELEKLNFEDVETINRFIHNCPKLKEITLTHKNAPKLISIENLITYTKNTKSITIKNINTPNLQKLKFLLWDITKDIEEIIIEDITAPNIKMIDNLIVRSTIKTLNLTKIGDVNVTTIHTLIKNCDRLETLTLNPLTNTKEIWGFIKRAPALKTEVISKIDKIEKLDTYFLTITPKNETLDLNKFKDIIELSSHLKKCIYDKENISDKYIYPSIKIGRHKLEFSEYSIILENNIHIVDRTEDEIVKEIIAQSRNETKENIENFLKTLENKKIFKNQECEKQLKSKLTIIKNLK